ncbi:hypothetical protein BASA50_005473 [Batrachochytrium salamandrivorans]|uniref:Uncharacterized protein n=1 Tax=Batrachochytrium salamandrivorans TaxID=1357716 RepID=A0ABQ8FCQ3_9FUNG|nr:hypothetical protein BASA50_005473 [Batrachochytrium salamandrivorans]
MQFFYLVSFAVAASYAAALPQPAGLSKRHSNNANTNSASGLEARSYQPGSNSYKESATFVSLERRDDFWGPPGGNDGSDTPPPPGSKVIKLILYDAFKRGNFSSANISSTIDEVGDGMVHFYVDGPKAGVAIGGLAGDMLAKYIRKADYVDTALNRWMGIERKNIIDAIKLAMGEAEFSKIAEHFFITLAALGAELVDKLRSRLEGSEVVKVLYGYLSKLVASIKKFIIDQQGFYEEIIKALKAPPPK